MAHLVALITDLELAAELVAAAEAAGHDVDVCTDESDAWEACEERTELVVDISSDSIDGVTLVDSMRAGGELQGFARLRSTATQISRRRRAQRRSASMSSSPARRCRPTAPRSWRGCSPEQCFATRRPAGSADCAASACRDRLRRTSPRAPERAVAVRQARLLPARLACRRSSDGWRRSPRHRVAPPRQALPRRLFLP